MGESTAGVAEPPLFTAIAVPGPGAATRTTTGSRTRAIDNDGIEEGGGGFGVPGTRSSVRVGAKSRARLRNTLGASGVAGSR
jgi:hypothetical protein